MKNFEQYNVEEINLEESKSINGGLAVAIIAGLAAAGAAFAWSWDIGRKYARNY